MTPEVKLALRKMQREYHKHRKSLKWKELRKRFKILKKKSIRYLNSKFVNELKMTNPGKWFKFAKRIGAVGQTAGGSVQVECLAGLSDQQSAEQIATHFSAISAKYAPVNLAQLPAHQPALPPPQLDNWSVYLKLKSAKKCKSTLPLDIPYNLIREFACELSVPLTNIFNSCLSEGKYPQGLSHGLDYGRHLGIH